MPNIFKTSLIFTFSPSPNVQSLLAGRIAGWSENFWHQQKLTVPNITALATKRAALLGDNDCQVIGWRITPYEYTGNKLIAKHSSVGGLDIGGKSGGVVNSPDDALRVEATAEGIPVSWNIFLHAIPDNVISSGRYVPNNQFSANVNIFRNYLTGQAGGIPPAYWLGRDPSQTAQRVLSVNGATGVVKVQAPLGVVANADFIRLRRVFSDEGLPIKGTYLCTAVLVNADGSVSYTLSGLPNLSRTTASGTARKDVIATSVMSTFDIRLLASRKVGRPTALYRGRRAKIRL
jgi:hypothetical protein